MSALRNLTFGRGVSRGTIPQLLTKFPLSVAAAPARARLGHGRARRRRQSRDRPVPGRAGPQPGSPRSLPQWGGTGREHQAPAAPLAKRTSQPASHIQACGAAPGCRPGPVSPARLGPSVPPPSLRSQSAAPRHRRQVDSPRALIGRHRRPRPPSRDDSGADSARRARRFVAVWPTAAVSQVEGRAAVSLRSRPLALFDITGARCGRPGCSRGWRAAGLVREPGSGAEEGVEEKEEEKDSREGGSAEPETSRANSPPSSSTHQAAAAAVSRNI